MWSLALVREGRDLAGGVLFAVLLNMKHLFACLAPVYFVYLLRHHCRCCPSPTCSSYVAGMREHGHHLTLSACCTKIRTQDQDCQSDAVSASQVMCQA